MARMKYNTLSEQMFYTLIVLNNEHNGSEIVSEVIKLTKNRIILKPGTLYTLLNQFLNEKIITETNSHGRKRCYIITEKGKDLLTNEIIRLNQLIIDANTYSRNI